MQCRLCLSSKSEYFPIQHEDIKKKIEIFTSLQIRDEDSTVCVSCKVKLESFWNFREMCIKSDETYRRSKSNRVSSKIKSEITSIHCEITHFNPVENHDKSDPKRETIIESRSKINSNCHSHFLTHDETRKFECESCDYKAKSKSALCIHLAKHSNEVRACELCSKVFKSKRNLNDHLRRAHSKLKKYSCTFCDKKFVDNCMLKVHLRTHTGVRPYWCTKCDKRFLRADGLKEHSVVHNSERVRNNCVKCNKNYASKRGLERHKCTGELDLIN